MVKDGKKEEIKKTENTPQHQMDSSLHVRSWCCIVLCNNVIHCHRFLITSQDMDTDWDRCILLTGLDHRQVFKNKSDHPERHKEAGEMKIIKKATGKEKLKRNEYYALMVTDLANRYKRPKNNIFTPLK